MLHVPLGNTVALYFIQVTPGRYGCFHSQQALFSICVPFGSCGSFVTLAHSMPGRLPLRASPGVQCPPAVRPQKSRTGDDGPFKFSESTLTVQIYLFPFRLEGRKTERQTDQESCRFIPKCSQHPGTAQWSRT